MLGLTTPSFAQSLEDLRALAIEDLTRIEITSVSKRPERLSEAPAAIFVISNEAIRRSGATTLPEALRLAPNLHVARRDAFNYAISARGMNALEGSNKLLVLMDGRTVYSPLHSGVFWDQQQTMLADVDRIEVISGPGGTLWGSNAVNGVINIITRGARETQGVLADFTAGTLFRGASMRYGGRIGDNGAFRVYGLGLDIEHSVTTAGLPARDDWQARQGGFRTDWSTNTDRITLQGDLFDNYIDDRGGRFWGRNLLARWTRPLENGAAIELQTYYDAANRAGPGVRDSRETFDIQAQHSFPVGERHRVVWGAGHRVNEDAFSNQTGFVLSPAGRTLQLSNIFAQDTVALGEDLKLTAGTKLEYNDYTGLEYMPSLRLGWTVTETDFLWGAVSRAVRTPSRIDRDAMIPGIFNGGPTFKSEKLMAYELGYRARPVHDATVSVSLFYNDYDDIRTTSFQSRNRLPLVLSNNLEGQTWGVEAWGDYRVLAWWRLSGGATAMHKELRVKPGTTDNSNRQAAGNDPGYQVSLRSAFDLWDDVELDAGLRWVDSLEVAVPGYLAADLRIGWHVSSGLDLSLGAFNLFEDRHAEAGSSAATLREFRRSVYLSARVRF